MKKHRMSPAVHTILTHLAVNGPTSRAELMKLIQPHSTVREYEGKEGTVQIVDAFINWNNGLFRLNGRYPGCSVERASLIIRGYIQKAGKIGCSPVYVITGLGILRLTEAKLIMKRAALDSL